MIVRNEAHIVTEVLDAVAPYISYWVIVDTGSADGTQETIRKHMAHLGVPGEVHERRWRNFGENRSEALQLAHGHSDYIWVMDADDTVRGRPDFTHLSADVYSMRISDGLLYWRRQLFRDGLPWRYVGVVHEYADCTEPFHEERLEGDYFIESRRLGARNNDPKKYERDRDLLLAEVQRDPTNERSAFYLAESYFNLGDFANARIWSGRRAEMGGWDEETFYALCQVARSMCRLGEPWPQVLDAYLRAWRSGLPALSRYMPSPPSTVPGASISSVISSHDAQRRYRFRRQASCSSIRPSTNGVPSMNNPSAHHGPAGTQNRLRCAVSCSPVLTSTARTAAE